MAQRSTPQLRVVPPTLEPDSVLLHQLCELSAGTSPAARTARHVGLRALAGAAAVAVIGGTTWVAGAVAGPGLGIGPAERPSSTTTGVPSPGGPVGTPQSDVTTSAPGSPWSPGLPGHETSGRNRTDAAGPPNPPGGQPPADAPGKGADKGKGDGTGNGHGRGHAYGHEQTPPGLDKREWAHGRGGTDNPGTHSTPGSYGKAKSHGKKADRGKGHGKGHGKGKGRR